MLPFAICMGTLSTAMVSIRIGSRLAAITGKFGLDDVFILIGWTLATVCLVLTVLLTNRYGYDRHIWDVPMDLWVPGAKMAWYIGWLYHVATTAIKLSILLFHRRIVGGLVSRKVQFVSWFSLVFIGAYGIAFLVLPLIQCRPIQASWRQYDMAYRATAKFHCASIQTMWNVSVAVSVCSVFTDFVSATIPVLWFLTTRMQLQKSERYGLVAIFAVGYLTVGAGIAKAAFISQAIDSGFIDKTGPGYNAYIAGTLEGNAAIACASAPAMYNCFKHFFSRVSLPDENLAKSSSESKIESPGAPVRAPSPSLEIADAQGGVYGE